MHDGQFFVLAIIAIIILRGVSKTWIRAHHGLPLEDSRKRRGSRGDQSYGAPDGGIDPDRKIRLLSDENEKLVGKIGRLEERLAVLERIATDPAERTAREIDALRDR